MDLVNAPQPPPPPPSKKMHNHCSQASSGYYSRFKRNRYWLCKIMGINKVHYGLCELNPKQKEIDA